MARQTRYPSEFREEAVALVKTSERPITDVARSLGINESTLWYWVNEDRKLTERSSDPASLSVDEVAELKRLRKENAQQKTDMEILRKAPPISRKRRCGDRLPLRPRLPSRTPGDRSLSGH